MALALDEPGPRPIIFCRLGVLSAVKLDYQPCGEAGEIDEIGADRHLPPPFGVGEPLA